MLVNSGRPESVKIGVQVQIRVVRVAGGRVSFGIEAPRHMPIVRKGIRLPPSGDPHPSARSFPT